MTVADACPTCGDQNDLDLSVGAFTQIATEAEGEVPSEYHVYPSKSVCLLTPSQSLGASSTKSSAVPPAQARFSILYLGDLFSYYFCLVSF